MGMISRSPTVRNAGPHLNRWRAYSLAAKAKLSDEFYSLPGGAAPIASWRSSDPKTQRCPNVLTASRQEFTERKAAELRKQNALAMALAMAMAKKVGPQHSASIIISARYASLTSRQYRGSTRSGATPAAQVGIRLPGRRRGSGMHLGGKLPRVSRCPVSPS